MKKILLSLFFISAVIFSVSAQVKKSTHKKMKFYYYPAANVYYDPANNQYAYDNNGTWSYVATLPENVELGDTTDRVLVYHNTPDVWTDNRIHKVKYKHGKLKKDKPKGKATDTGGTGSKK